MTVYIAQNTLKNDKKQTRFEVGDTVTDKDFPKKVIQHWLETGELVLEEPTDNAEEK